MTVALTNIGRSSANSAFSAKSKKLAYPRVGGRSMSYLSRPHQGPQPSGIRVEVARTTLSSRTTLAHDSPGDALELSPSATLTPKREHEPSLTLSGRTRIVKLETPPSMSIDSLVEPRPALTDQTHTLNLPTKRAPAPSRFIPTAHAGLRKNLLGYQHRRKTVKRRNAVSLSRAQAALLAANLARVQRSASAFEGRNKEEEQDDPACKEEQLVSKQGELEDSFETCEHEPESEEQKRETMTMASGGRIAGARFAAIALRPGLFLVTRCDGLPLGWPLKPLPVPHA
ncbi:hypothetical protein PSEUBRA_004974 [Kalmanozyma brasiliensis GHG001]|uniref:uncharacterized protein n=1 Tax=Kalmanozyma brasiliensis (strain GHG001) TaxID=1365824 RepID=UPI002868129C|nr:uncharacterized protein PSEUBRA_004974 [Kalmanozyma brasiliensis GHG001]KAF6767463.1 hypothetical protein PSEUBRA_004974 [Kalmanozyma brasiliensis GHG001]